jgi:hypothetical protein
MRRTLQFGTTAVAVCMAVAGLVAQTTSTATTGTSGQTTAPKAGDKITISGCVERADQVAAPASAGTTVDSLSFVLINTPPQQVGTTGSAGAANKDASMEKGYRLDAEVGKLNPHVGHKVEIAGTVAEPAMATGTASAANGPKVKVDTIKMLSETCAR